MGGKFLLFYDFYSFFSISILAELALESAGKRIARRILTTCWNSLLSLLLSTLNPYLMSSASKEKAAKSRSSFFLSSSASSGPKTGDEKLMTGLDCLQIAMILCNRLELHNRCGEMLEPLTSIICPDQIETLLARKTKSHSAGSKGGGGGGGSGSAKYSLNDLISIEDVLQNGLELGSQSQDCWKYVMR